MHDPELYPDPFVFSPERFYCAGKSGVHWTTSRGQPDPRSFAFGFGRRTCPGMCFPFFLFMLRRFSSQNDLFLLPSGMHFAELAMLLVMASTLSHFRIEVSNGGVSPEVEFTTGITR